MAAFMAALRLPNSKIGDASVAPVNQNGDFRKSLSSSFSRPAPRLITKDGNLLIGAGNSLSADTLAKAMYSAGAYMAMQLDINGPYISTALFYPQPDGSVRADKFMDSMSPSAANFLGTRERDFFYLTLDESRYR